MAPRKRTTPKKKPARKVPGLFSAASAAGLSFVARHPRQVLGTSAFLVVFSIISANALWYQTGEHPSPMLRTRDNADPLAILGYTTGERLAPEGNVTTFSFERSNGKKSNGSSSQANVVDIQRELARRGLYQGPANGVVSQDLAAAILAFEEGSGMAPTGKPSDELLIALMVDSAAIVSAIPTERPMEDGLAATPIDPVADAIRSANVPNSTSSKSALPNSPVPMPKPQVMPKAQVSEAPPTPTPAPAAKAPQLAPASQRAPTQLASVPQQVQQQMANATQPAGALPNDMVAKIQVGLINSSYVDVTVDGLAGPKTRDAIRSFEKHYRLPETGTPNQLVLDKLTSIGAFNRPAM